MGSWPHGSLNHFFGVFVPDFLWPIILLCLVLSLYLVYLRVLPHVHVHISQPRWGLAKRPMGRLSIASFLTSKELSRLEGFLDSENYLERAQLPFLSCCVCFGVSVHRECFPWGDPSTSHSELSLFFYQELTKKTHYFLSIQ